MTNAGWRLAACAAVVVTTVFSGAACGRPDDPRLLTFSGSAVGREGEVVRRQLDRFARAHPHLRVELRVTPDAADQRHQLYVQWLNGHATDPDVLQLDVIWTAEFAAAGWIAPLDRTGTQTDDFLPAAMDAARWRGRLFALPWFVDVGLLYYRTDLVDTPPTSLSQLEHDARRLLAERAVPYGLVWQGARYEGLITVFLEHLGAFGGRILDDRGQVVVDEPAAVRALTYMRDSARAGGIVPRMTLTWQEEQARLAFQNGQAAFMRNWPYAWALLSDGTSSKVAGRIGVTAFPAAVGGKPTAALGGSLLAVNARSSNRAMAQELIAFLTAPEQMLERARLASQLPARSSLYDTPALDEALAIPTGPVRTVLAAAMPRPSTPVYTELSEILQVRLHRALISTEEPAEALAGAAGEIRALLERAGLSGDGEADR